MFANFCNNLLSAKALYHNISQKSTQNSPCVSFMRAAGKNSCLSQGKPPPSTEKEMPCLVFFALASFRNFLYNRNHKANKVASRGGIPLSRQEANEQYAKALKAGQKHYRDCVSGDVILILRCWMKFWTTPWPPAGWTWGSSASPPRD